MADDPTPTPNLEPTDQTPEVTAETVAAGETTEATQSAADDLGETALGGKADATDAGAAETDAEGAKAEVPETYELAVPEGFEKLDPEAVSAATPIFKELGLSNDQANKLVPIAAEMAKRIVTDRDQQLLGTILEQRKDWLETARKDPDIGGANWDATLRTAAQGLDRLGFPKGSPLRVALDESGFGNHPEMIRLMSKVGNAIGEDGTFVRGEGGAGKKSDAELFYGAKD